MNRDYVLKNFWNKLTDAKKQNVREVRLSLKELDDLGFVIYELMSEYYNKTIEGVKNGESQSSSSNSNDEFKMDGGQF